MCLPSPLRPRPCWGTYSAPQGPLAGKGGLAAPALTKNPASALGLWPLSSGRKVHANIDFCKLRLRLGSRPTCRSRRRSRLGIGRTTHRSTSSLRTSPAANSPRPRCCRSALRHSSCVTSLAPRPRRGWSWLVRFHLAQWMWDSMSRRSRPVDQSRPSSSRSSPALRIAKPVSFILFGGFLRRVHKAKNTVAWWCNA